MSNRFIYNVEYNIPRVNITLPGRQNRSNDGILRLTPGMDEVYEFVFGNMDGVPINLLPFKVKIVFWSRENLEIDHIQPGGSKILFAKEIPVTDPYKGRIVCLFTNQDTLKIASESGTGLRWGLFMINEEGNVFPAQVDRNGGRNGTVMLNMDVGIPTAEVIKSA